MTIDTTSVRSRGQELVPLAERVRHMQMFRPLAGTAAILLAALTSDAAFTGLVPLIAITMAYLTVTMASAWAWRRMAGRGLVLFGGMLLIDGLYLALAIHLSGGSASPVRYLTLLHLIAVALLASYRTSLKLALWHSLLTLVFYHAYQTGVLAPAAGATNGVGSQVQRLAVFVTILWSVALVTATFSAVNERELRRRRFDLEALARFAAELETTASPPAIGAALLANTADAFGFGRAILLASPSGAPRVLAQHGCAGTVTDAISAHPGSVLQRLQRNKSTLLAAAVDSSVDPWLDAAIPNARNLVIVPLSAEEQIVGALICEQQEQSGSRIQERVVTMVERFASHAALALRSRWLLEEIRDAAATDGLTGIRNRRAFDERLDEELARAGRSGEPVSLLMLDIDHFKALNDDHGHQAGDDVLREIGAALAADCRTFDIPARYGGEEFAIILPRTDPRTALTVAERLRGVVETADTSIPVTVSVGVATAVAGLDSPQALIAAADGALYESKRAGRNRVTPAAPSAESTPPDRTADGKIDVLRAVVPAGSNGRSRDGGQVGHGAAAGGHGGRL